MKHAAYGIIVIWVIAVMIPAGMQAQTSIFSPEESGFAPFDPHGAGAAGGDARTDAAPVVWTIEAYVGGMGFGVVRSEDGVIDCGDACGAEADDGMKVVLKAIPAAGSVFVGWSGNCSGVNSLCSLVMDGNKNIIAFFAQAPRNMYIAPAFDFLDTVAQAVKKRAKLSLGYSPIASSFGNPLRTLQKNTVDARAMGPRWTIAANGEGELIARGSLVGQIADGGRSNMFIEIALRTGCTYLQFNSRKSNWIAHYCNSEGPERAELFDMSGQLYQKENTVQLLGYQGTVFGAFGGGALFVTAPGSFPAVNPGRFETIAVPRGDGAKSVVPVEKILSVIQEVARAVRDALYTTSYAAGGGTASMREAIAALPRYQKEKRALDDAHAALYQLLEETDWEYISQYEYDDMQNKIRAFQKQQERVAAQGAKLGIARMFARDGDWRTADSPLADQMIKQGVDTNAALLIAQASAPFDFYAISSVEGADNKVIKGSCSVSRCFAESASKAEARALFALAGQYARAVAAADAKNNAIQKALFFGAEDT